MPIILRRTTQTPTRENMLIANPFGRSQRGNAKHTSTQASTVALLENDLEFVKFRNVKHKRT